MSFYKLSEIWIYPVKSLGGFQVSSAFAEERGLQYDRRWMIVDENNRFLTQREIPEMALIQVSLGMENNKLKGIHFSHKIDQSVQFTLDNPFNFDDKPDTINVLIWDDIVDAFEIKGNVNNWLSRVLGISCKLVCMPNQSIRKVEEKHNPSGKYITSFSDGYPYLIIGQSALDMLNLKLEMSIKIDRFRPNFVFIGGEAHDEDMWKVFKIGNAEFEGTKICARCPIPTINQQTGIKNKELLKTLYTYRLLENRVYFGQNLLIIKPGLVRVGDPIIN